VPRGVRQPSEVFKGVLRDAEDELRLSSKKAAKFEHNGIRGDERAGGLAEFFRGRLPVSFSVAKGEAIDFRDHRTGQLDLMIFDSAGSAPISSQHENLLLPCEALYVVIESKTTLRKEELVTSYAAAKRVRELAPFKKPFIGPRTGGAPADDHCRCMYLVFAHESNLGAKDWLSKEFKRCEEAARASSTTLDLIERVVVLDRGMIHPGLGRGKAVEEEEEGIFLEFYLHVVNFLNRERARRPPVDWQVYSARTSEGWGVIRSGD
jgi:hypothetical protein